MRPEPVVTEPSLGAQLLVLALASIALGCSIGALLLR
jgi:hypothetical protein